MNILDLPEEIIIMIIKLLDIKTQYNIYNTNTCLKNIVSMYSVINSCKFSLNTMATANSLKLNFFKDIAGHLQELNLSAVKDLSKSSLLPAIKKLKNLNTLDVSYTKINIIDLLELHKVCPTIKDISINFLFDKSVKVMVPLKILERCQNMFEQFERVHFVGTSFLFYSNLPLTLLQKAKLSELCMTLSDCALTIYDSGIDHKEMIQFKKLKIFLLNWKEDNTFHGRLNSSVILSMVDLSKSEFIIVTRCGLNISKVFVSSRFKDFFQEQFNVQAIIITEWTYHELSGNAAIMIWDTVSTVFDHSFFVSLSNQLKQYFPYHVSSVCSEDKVPANLDWFYTMPMQHDFARLERNVKPVFKRKRLAPQDVLLNYDSICQDKEKVKINLIFNNQLKCPVALSNNYEYLKKITYLSLTGHVVCNPDFFKILFCCCNNLVTINVATTSKVAKSLGQYIPLSTYIKNVRLVASTIEFENVFQSLSQCKYLENVHLIHENSGPNDLADPIEMIMECDRLYNLSICMPMTETKMVKNMKMLKQRKSMFARYYLNIELNFTFSDRQYGYDPFMEPFNLNPIKIV